ncbi:MAG: cob(I)yrinic acid a,c-diamide adenosyltransferase [Elusimicrobiota bacterium]|jgi:cob(I)alamin adenosyltransferase
MKIYTRTGDSGMTSLRKGGRVRKDHPVIAACGELDELSSRLGAALSLQPAKRSQLEDALERIQKELFLLAATVSGQEAPHPSTPSWIAVLEHEIDQMSGDLPQINSCILPGGTPQAASLHLARTACRTAERALSALGPNAGKPNLSYLNRLSDWLFTAARSANHRAGRKDTACTNKSLPHSAGSKGESLT